LNSGAAGVETTVGKMTLPATGSPLHVLLIHRRNATEGYGPYLADEGFRVTEANDTDDGVAKALVEKPDFIVLDFDLDGETTGRLKAHAATRAIPVIALAKLDEVRSKGAV
jgi:DNA-binding response OmpR family regulator